MTPQEPCKQGDFIVRIKQLIKLLIKLNQALNKVVKAGKPLTKKYERLQIYLFIFLPSWFPKIRKKNFKNSRWTVQSGYGEPVSSEGLSGVLDEYGRGGPTLSLSSTRKLKLLQAQTVQASPQLPSKLVIANTYNARREKNIIRYVQFHGLFADSTDYRSVH